MFCPICKGEFREGFTECTGCQVNLVANLDNITEKIKGEFLLCHGCEREFHDIELDHCPGCGLKLVRAVLHDDTYVFLEEPVMEFAPEEPEGACDHFDYFVDIDDADAVVVLESEDLALLTRIQEILNEAKISFCFKPAEDTPSTSLGSIFGVGSPLARSFPRVVVQRANEAAALNIIANHPELDLFGVPEELLEGEDDESEEGYEED
ncbi:MAG: hypothetical protein PHD82_06525 [Candidatus Riflebacteria bacterium]|nr:hypothetical protein [Candidatus Riflebacteria bacterium]